MLLSSESPRCGIAILLISVSVILTCIQISELEALYEPLVPLLVLLALERRFKPTIKGCSGENTLTHKTAIDPCVCAEFQIGRKLRIDFGTDLELCSGCNLNVAHDTVRSLYHVRVGIFDVFRTISCKDFDVETWVLGVCWHNFSLVAVRVWN